MGTELHTGGIEAPDRSGHHHLCQTSTLPPRAMVIADLGCGSGPNALTLVSIALEAIHSQCTESETQQPPKEVCIFLNDLPGNDFNSVVNSLVSLREVTEPSSLILAGVVPGSFYERLFASGSLHLVCTSNSLHWLPEAPKELRMKGIPAYDVDEIVRREHFPVVHDTYAQQFRKDFGHFLELRARRPDGPFHAWYEF